MSAQINLEDLGPPFARFLIDGLWANLVDYYKGPRRRRSEGRHCFDGMYRRRVRERARDVVSF